VVVVVEVVVVVVVVSATDSPSGLGIQGVKSEVCCVGTVPMPVFQAVTGVWTGGGPPTGVLPSFA